METFFKIVGYGIVFILIMFGCAFCSLTLNINMLENDGYTYIEYDAGSYKVYDDSTKVIYMYSGETNEFHPLYNADGTLMIYKGE